MKALMNTTEITVDDLRQYLSYDPLTGLFRWNKSGRIAGNIQHGRRRIGFQKRIYKASRLAWFYMTGVWPSHTIDHIDRNSLNDRWYNLRDVPMTTQIQNRTLGWERPDRVSAKRKEHGYYA